MKKLITIAIIFFAAYLNCVAQEKGIVIGHVGKNELGNKFPTGCSCSYSSKETGDIVFIGNGYYSAKGHLFPGPGWMLIDDKLVNLKASKEVAQETDHRRKVFSSAYESGKILVIIKTSMTQEGEEQQDYEGELTVQKGSRTQTIHIKGHCGC